MKTSLNKIIIYFLIFASLFSFQNVFAYDDETTHPALTDEIVDFYNLSFPNKQLTSQQKEWIVQGSILEDTPPRWINHFYDPIYKEGWSGEHTGIYDKETVQWVSKNIVAPRGITPVSSLNWLHNEQLQAKYAFYKGAKTWEKGILEMIKGNEKEAYMILGYVLHLVEDATVPEHTRNDTHAHELEKATKDYGSPYEEYLKKYTRQNIEKELNIVGNLKKENLYPIQRQTIDEYLISLAEYSNKYFFSKDTINDPKYQSPKIIRDDGNFGYGKDENGKEFLLVKKIQNKDKFNTIDSFILDDKSDIIIDDYFFRLSRQAVLNGAGVIDLFHKDIEFKKEYSPHLFTYDASVFNYFELPNISFTGEIARIKSITQTIFAKTVSTTKNISSSVGNLLGINQSQPSQPQQISLSNEIVIPPVIENPIVETKTETQIIENNNPIEIKKEILNQNKPPIIETISKIKENIPEKQIKQAKQIIEDNQAINIKPISNKIVFQYNNVSESSVVNNISGNNSNNSNSGSSGGSPQTYPKILITEIQLSPTSNRFIELYNPNNSAINLTDWYIHRKTQTGSVFNSLVSKTYFKNKIISANDYFLISRETMDGADIVLNSLTLTDSNAIQLKNPNGEIVDKVGWGGASDCEGSCVANPIEGQSIQREFQNSAFVDTDNNVNDFEIQTCSSPNAQSVNCQTTATSTSSHLVISEIYPDKIGNNFDFVELYNPTDSSIELGNYSLKRQTNLATSTNLLSSFSSSQTIAAKSFFLVGLSNYGNSAYTTADKLNSSYSLPTSGSETISVLLFENDTIIDQTNYNPANLTDSQSLERKAFATSTIDSMVSGEHKFSGNGYDSDSDTDFILRNLPNPQNSQNFPEPRNAPAAPQNFSIQYSSSTMSLDLNWNASQDYNGATSTITYRIMDISNSSSTFSEINTTSTSASISINEVGRDYSFSIKAFDAEGFDSASSTTSILVPNQAPAASFVFSPLSPEVNQEIIFNAASSTDSDGQIVSYQWDFGDNVTASTTYATTTHLYSTANDYSVQLTVFDNNNVSSIATSTISISAQNSTSTLYQQTDYANSVKNWNASVVLHQRYIRQTLGNNLSGTISSVDYWIKFLQDASGYETYANFKLIACDDIDYVLNCQAVINQNFPFMNNYQFQISLGQNTLIFSSSYILNSNKFYYLEWDFPYPFWSYSFRGDIELGYSTSDNYATGYLWTYNPTYEDIKPYDNKDLYFILH